MASTEFVRLTRGLPMADQHDQNRDHDHEHDHSHEHHHDHDHSHHVHHSERVVIPQNHGANKHYCGNRSGFSLSSSAVVTAVMVDEIQVQTHVVE